MPFPEPVKRQPVETRQLLLEVAEKTIREKGLAGVTLDGVAKAAGVSKGGLLHHFPNKQHLIDAVIVELHQRFLSRIKKICAADPIESGKETRAYLKVATRERDEQDSQLCSILAVEARDNPTMRSQWRETRIRMMTTASPAGEGTDPILLAIIQLATDGLWLAETEGLFDKSSTLYRQIIERLEQMTLPPTS